MKVLLVGGGSGGHITPLLAVAHKLREQQPKAGIYHVLEKGGRFADLSKDSMDIDAVYHVRAGKFRRYHGESWLRRLFDVPTNLKNLRDLFYTGIGLIQSIHLLRRLRPDVVFIKGSAVGVPVGKACQLLHIPYFTHDSDSVASLTNKLLAKHAAVHAVGLPLSFYSRADETMRYTGIPLAGAYQAVTATKREAFRKQLHIPANALVVTVTGGSLGAVRLNEAFQAVAPNLLAANPHLYILHQSGVEKSAYGQLPDDQKARVTEVKYTNELVAFTGAADVVVARAGATTIAELAVQGRACIFVPNPQLTGGQQTKNAEYLAKHQAAVILSEQQAADPKTMQTAIQTLLDDTARRQGLQQAITKLAKADAAEALTAIIVELATQK